MLIVNISSELSSDEQQMIQKSFWPLEVDDAMTPSLRLKKEITKMNKKELEFELEIRELQTRCKNKAELVRRLRLYNW